jgi:glycosyltransferase involved in cell wall biosynthesis
LLCQPAQINQICREREINQHQETKEAFTSHTQPENKVIPKDTREVIAKLTTFKECAGFVITALEGDDKVVPEPNGGIAKFGINSIAHPEEAYQIAKKDYWDPIDADNLPENFRCVAMDTVFNHGVNGGKALIAKANLNPVALLEIRRQEYSDYVAANPKRNAQYEAGWYNRVSELYDQLDQPLDPESSLRPNSRKRSQFASLKNS